MISGIIAIVGLIGIIQTVRNSANMGIDFSGGTSVQLSFTQPVSLERARDILAHNHLKEANLQEIKEGNKLTLRNPLEAVVLEARAMLPIVAILDVWNG